MRRIADVTVFLPSCRASADLAESLRETAHRQGETVSEVTRQALTWYLSHPVVKAQTKEV